MKTDTDPNNLNLSEELQNSLLYIIEYLDKEDDYIRKQQVKIYKRDELYWHGVQNIFWSEVANDYRIVTQENQAGESDRDETDNPFYDFVINIYKAHGQGIIAALSQALPGVKFFPDDADNPNDLSAAKARSKVSELIHKHNQAQMLFIKALFLLYNQGTVFGYNYHKADEEFGTTKIDKIGTVRKQTTPDLHLCSECMQTIRSVPPPEINPSMGNLNTINEGWIIKNYNKISTWFIQKFHQGMMAGEMGQIGQVGNIPLPQTINQVPSLQPESPEMQSPMEMCPSCQKMVTPIVIPGDMEDVEQSIGEEEVPKSRELLDVFGPLHVKIPYYARRQKDIGYLFLSTEEHFAKVQEEFPNIADKIGPQSDDSDKYDRWARSPVAFSPMYRGDEFRDLITVRRCWLRPWSFNILGKEKQDQIDELRKLFPDGVKTTFVGRVYAEARKEKLDKRWTISTSFESSYIHSDPMGISAIPLQDIKNTLVNLKVQHVEYGIPTSYADPKTLHFDEYGKHEANPGYIYPAKALPGQPLGNSFYTGTPTQLPAAVEELETRVENDTQFVLGSFPSIYGGPSQGKSRTFGEYSMSRNMSLQRLSTTWKMLNEWWSSLIGKAVDSYVDNMIEDEHYVVDDKNSYVNVVIKKEELQGGKISRVEPESSENFPISASQKRDIITQLIQYNNPQINGVVFSPDNFGKTMDYLSFDDFSVAGEDQRIKQLHEINELLKGEPTINPQTGQEIPSIQVEPEIDDDGTHLQVITTFLVSEIGQEVKKINIKGYNNCMAHLKQHQEILQQKQMMQQQQAPQPAPQGG